jgi:tagatose 1,6-diphosphate aldolase
MTDFQFLDVGTLSDDEIELVVIETTSADEKKGYVPAYMFDIRLAGKSDSVGRIHLRIGSTPRLIMYAGHIGYGIGEPYRGHGYAAKACRLIKPVALDHGLKTLWITCNPDNIPSRRTCEIIGGELVEIVDLPEDSDMYQDGERQKCRYRWDLTE